MTRARRSSARTVLVAAVSGTMLAGCSVGIGNVTEVPRYQQVEADGVALEVLDGMEQTDVPAGFDAFWQTAAGASTVSVGVATDVEAGSFVDAQLAEMERVMDGFEVQDGQDGGARFTGTGVDGESYTGLVDVRGTTGVMASVDQDTDEAVLQHVVDSVSTDQ